VHVFETQVPHVIVVSNTQHSNQQVSTSLSQNEATVPSQTIFICLIKPDIVVPRYAEDVMCVS
jgi:hypothetical protein